MQNPCIDYHYLVSRELRLHCTMLKEAFPLLVDEVGIHETVTASEEPEAQVSVAKPPSTRPRLPVIFNRLKTKPRLKAVKQVINLSFGHFDFPMRHILAKINLDAYLSKE